MLNILFGFFFFLLLVFLYGYFNDRKLKQLPPEAELVFSPTRLTPRGAREAMDTWSKNTVVMKDFLPPRTGRRYIVVGGVCPSVFTP